MSNLKDLPKVFAKPIEKDMRNNEEIFYSRLFHERKDQKDILKEIDKIFGSKDFVYKSKVEITTKDGVFEEEIVGKSGSSLLTLDGKSISIPTILDIKKL